MRKLKNFRSPILRDALGIGLIKFLAIPVTMVTAILLARTLGPNNFGVYAFVLSIVNLVALLLTGGISQLMTREVASALQENDLSIVKGVIISAIFWGVGSSVLTVLIVWSVLLFFKLDLHSTMLTVSLLGFLALPILCLSPIWAGTLRGYGQGAKSQIPGLLLAPIAQITSLLILFYLNVLNVVSVMFCFLFANLLSAVAGVFFVRSTIGLTFKNVVGQYQIGLWARSSAIFTGIALISYLNTQIGVILLGLGSTMADVGAFQIADRGAQLAILNMAIIELVLAPHIARYHRANDKEGLKRLFKVSRLICGVFTLALGMPLVLMGRPIVNMLFGEVYVDNAVQPLAIITIALMFRSLFGPTSTLLSMTGNEKTTLSAQVLAVTVNIILTLILSPFMGAVGAALGAAVGIIVWTLLLASQASKYLNLDDMSTRRA